jgi:23S rRNA pseudouridine1911/1915/1917 synthase
VHRLDKDTSGCLVVAKTPLARASLEAQFRGRSVSKLYLAVVHGRPPAEGEVTAPIGRDPRQRKRMRVRDGGKEAVSRFRRLECFTGASLLEVAIATGRTHQIRVHLASLGHPVVGDRVYGRRRSGADLLGRFPRQALHAVAIRLRHPRRGDELSLRAPLPMDMEELLRALRQADGRAAPAAPPAPGRGPWPG